MLDMHAAFASGHARKCEALIVCWPPAICSQLRVIINTSNEEASMKNAWVRDAVLLTAAAAIGWFAHGRPATVYAAPSSSSSARGSDVSGNLAFQLGGAGLEGDLTIYSQSDHSLYVYPNANSNNHINCAFVLHIHAPGAPIDRENCAPGSPF
jgi:hypothetical protein